MTGLHKPSKNQSHTQSNPCHWITFTVQNVMNPHLKHPGWRSKYCDTVTDCEKKLGLVSCYMISSLYSTHTC